MSIGVIEAVWVLGGFFLGVSLTLALGRWRRFIRERRSRAAEASLVPEGQAREADPRPNPGDLTGAVSPRLVMFLARSIRDSLKQLRRLEGCPPDVIESLERVAWRARMIVAPPRPMQAKVVSTMTLLQQASEEVESLREGRVSASWSLMNRQPVRVDPERAQAAFREVLEGSAAMCEGGGRLAIRIQDGTLSGYPVQVEIEAVGRGAEPDPVPVLVARHVLESQGARVEIDGPVTRVHLRTSIAEAALPPGLES